MNIKKEYSQFWGYELESTGSEVVKRAQEKDIPVTFENMAVLEGLFIQAVQEQGLDVVKKHLPLILTLEASQPLCEQLSESAKEETSPDDEGCPLCESVSKSLSLLGDMTAALESAGKPIPERFANQKVYLTNTLNSHTLFHARNDDILSVRQRVQSLSSKLTEEANKLIYGDMTSVTESVNSDMKSLTTVKNVTEKQFQAELCKLVALPDDSPLEVVKSVRNLVSIASAHTDAVTMLLESSDLSDDTKAVLGSKDSKAVKQGKELPKKFIGLVEGTFNKIKRLGKEQQVEMMVRGGLYRKFFNAIKYIITYGVVGYFSWVLAVILILVMMANRDATDMKIREEIIRELEGDLRIVREKISDANNEGDKKMKYELMRIEKSLVTNLDKLQKKSAIDEARAETMRY